MLFVIRDRGSGYYVAQGGGPADLWTMQKDIVFAVIVDAPDDRDRELWKGIAAIAEYFGENKANGFDLRPERLCSMARAGL